MKAKKLLAIITLMLVTIDLTLKLERLIKKDY